MGLGMLIHLILDELNSFKIGSWGIIRAKKSLGTALKIFDFDNLKSSIVAFTLVFFLTGAVIRERSLTKELEDRGEAQQASEYIAEHSEDVLEQLKDNNPEDFDRAVIYWAQEHDLVLQPEDVDSKNQKWEELKQMVIPEN